MHYVWHCVHDEEKNGYCMHDEKHCVHNDKLSGHHVHDGFIYRHFFTYLKGKLGYFCKGFKFLLRK